MQTRSARAARARAAGQENEEGGAGKAPGAGGGAVMEVAALVRDAVGAGAALGSEEWEARNKALRHEKDIMSKHYQDLNRAMKRLRDKEHKKLQALIMNSDKASKALDEKLAKGEKLLKLAGPGSP